MIKSIFNIFVLTGLNFIVFINSKSIDVDQIYYDFENIGLKTVTFRAGCITGSNHSGAKLHGFLSFLVKSCLKNKEYSINL